MAVEEEARHSFVKSVSEELSHMVCSLPNVTNWHKGAHNRVTAISPKRMIDVGQDSKAPVLAGYVTG